MNRVTWGVYRFGFCTSRLFFLFVRLRIKRVTAKRKVSSFLSTIQHAIAFRLGKCAGSVRNAVRTEVATLDVYTPHAETCASAQRRAIRDLRREGVSRTAPTSIDQLTNISTDTGSRSMIRRRSNPSLAFAGKGGIVPTDAGEFSVLARIDCTCWMGAKGGPHTQSLPVT